MENIKVVKNEFSMHESYLRNIAPNPRPLPNSIDHNHVVKTRVHLDAG